MMVIIGAIIVIGVIYLLLKRHESRMVLIAAGILMAVIAGKPMAALDAFAKSMTNAGLITSVCSCMGFAMVMPILLVSSFLLAFSFPECSLWGWSKP